ncbi:MAG: MFS transporter [archaeon]|jgi:MFS family permease
MNKYGKILLIGSLLWYFGEGMLGPLFTVFAQQVGGDVLEITSAWAIYLIVLGVLTIIVGKYSDKMDKEKLMIAGYGLNAIFTFGYLFVNDAISLFLVQAGLGFATALATPTWNALFAKSYDQSKDGSAWGIADGLPRIVTAIGIILGGLIVTFFSFTVLFVSMGIIQLIAAFYQALALKQLKKKNNSKRKKK